MKVSRSRRLLREIRSINRAIKKAEKNGRLSAKILLVNERARLVVRYIKSLRIKAVSVDFLKSLLL